MKIFSILILLLVYSAHAASAEGGLDFKARLDAKFREKLNTTSVQQHKASTDKTYDGLVAQAFSGNTVHLIPSDLATKKCILNAAAVWPGFLLKHYTEERGIQTLAVNKRCEELSQMAYKQASGSLYGYLSFAKHWMLKHNITFEEMLALWWDDKDSIMFFSVLADFLRGVQHIQESPKGWRPVKADVHTGVTLMPEHLRVSISKKLFDRPKESITLGSLKDIRAAALLKLKITESEFKSLSFCCRTFFEDTTDLRAYISRLTERHSYDAVYKSTLNGKDAEAIESMYFFGEFLYWTLTEKGLAPKKTPHPGDVSMHSSENTQVKLGELRKYLSEMMALLALDSANRVI